MKNKFLNWILNYGISRINKIHNFIDYMSELMINAIRKNPKTILAHIWRFSNNRYFLSPYILDKTEKIIEQLQDSQVALEIYSSMENWFNLTNEENETIYQKILNKIHPSLKCEIIRPKEFITEIFKISKKYDICYSFGSDGHSLSNVGKIGKIKNANELLSLINKIGINENKIVTREFFNFN